VTSEGKESVLAFIDPGEIFGELSLFGQAQREEFAEAMEKSTIVRIPGDEMQRLMSDRPEIVLQVTRLMGMRRQRIERRLKALLFRSNRDRLVYLLLELGEKYGQPCAEGIKLGIRLSHQDMASMIGSTRETVTVLLGELQYARSLIVKRRQIILTNLEQLAAVLDELTPEVERLIQSSAQRAGQSPNQTQQPFAKRRIPE
jgi:CRP-like cAMP-binding protein